MRSIYFLAVLACLIPLPIKAQESKTESAAAKKEAKATFGAGCFWCVEAVFKRINGVKSVTPGFMGGRLDDPTYNLVKGGKTGHVEVAHLTYDPDVISYDKLLAVFWHTHDPTTRNRQGPDKGTHYRSVVFFHTPEQKNLARKAKVALSKARMFASPIVTQIQEASEFYPAGPEHIDFFQRNPEAAYCRNHIRPKIEKLEKLFADLLKPDPVN